MERWRKGIYFFHLFFFMSLKLRQSTNWIPTGNGRGADGWPGITTNVLGWGDVETFIFMKFICGKEPLS